MKVACHLSSLTHFLLQTDMQTHREILFDYYTVKRAVGEILHELGKGKCYLLENSTNATIICVIISMLSEISHFNQSILYAFFIHAGLKV